MKIVLALLSVAAIFALYVRLAPSKSERWHLAVSDINASAEGGFKTSLVGDDFTKLHNVIITTPRTRVLAGDPASKHVTYVSRTKLWGFPDYITVQQIGNDTEIVGRLRFGRKDFGVNRARIEGWFATLK